MSNINPRIIENVSIKDVKGMDEFLKLYNKFDVRDESTLKKLVLEESNGKLTEEQYEKNIQQSRLYTKDGAVPSKEEWAEVRAEFREVGNNKIKECKEKVEFLAKTYSYEKSIDADGVLITPKQAHENLENAKKKVQLANIFQIAVTILLGTVFFVAVVLLSKLMATTIDMELNLITLQLCTGVLSLVGLIIGAFVGYKIMGAVEKNLKNERDKAERIEASHHAEIIKLQMDLKTSDELINKIQDQYGVEILVVKDYSKVLKKEEKEPNKK